ncbi:2-C-methyl-D-erythritol 2,4-cyclodiphosphate synthase [Aeoliella mucimassa]|uniref:2-C-methyl-D-erythritol 2,4-cyclodiphosphate synthase n=1 Tax=Aeoliella mucimassa TaxID=2527972 RepID=A0A518AIX0_9BACT|nr:2-C-methyl-D-erythritol 2,4-cyclodiphosphate synthase [Aeoliella mucimassa]QDU54685.1 2-C-methyl-D-erythritol 2,4-cyclodiphosphate synthase [Aeoliella mucimassa]
MYRIGLGDDTHRTAPGGPLVLGGIEVPHDQHLVGHSDADVLLHALTDALLGAAGLPDIGQLFPNTADENRGRDSAEFLTAAYAKVTEAGYQLVNADCVIAAQRPKISPFKDAMRHRIAGLLRVNPLDIGIKAKTGEEVGPVGRCESIEARAVVLLEKIPKATS